MANGFKATVKFAKSWKGEVAGTVVVHTGTGFGDCGIDFKEGAYLFYAYRGKDDEWYTDVCTRTAPLETTGEETFELDGQLPNLTGASQKPILDLKGKINDAGYDGYVFTLRNRLHDRIFYLDYHCTGQWIQVRRKGKWVDYAPNYFLLSSYRPRIPGEVLARWRRDYAKLEPEDSVVFLDRLKTTTIFVGRPVEEVIWRVGFQYLNEQEHRLGQDFNGPNDTFGARQLIRPLL